MANSSPTAATEATKATTMPQPPVPDAQLSPEPEIDSATSLGQRAVYRAGGNSPETLPGRYGALTGQMGHAPGQQGSALRQLQRGYGNQYVGRVIQAKLTVGQPGDVYEQEADRVADQIMRMPEDGAGAGVAVSEQIQPLQIQRMCTACEEEEEEPIRRKEAGGAAPAVTPAVESRLDATRGGGQPLPESVRAQMEPRFGADFSGVRLHTGGEAAALNRDLQAQAFTRQRDIYFGAGRYQPETWQGNRLLAHELAHVVQQRRLQTPQIQKFGEEGQSYTVIAPYQAGDIELSGGETVTVVEWDEASLMARVQLPAPHLNAYEPFDIPKAYLQSGSIPLIGEPAEPTVVASLPVVFIAEELGDVSGMGDSPGWPSISAPLSPGLPGASAATGTAVPPFLGPGLSSTGLSLHVLAMGDMSWLATDDAARFALSRSYWSPFVPRSGDIVLDRLGNTFPRNLEPPYLSNPRAWVNQFNFTQAELDSIPQLVRRLNAGTATADEIALLRRVASIHIGGSTPGAPLASYTQPGHIIEWASSKRFRVRVSIPSSAVIDVSGPNAFNQFGQLADITNIEEAEFLATVDNRARITSVQPSAGEPGFLMRHSGAIRWGGRILFVVGVATSGYRIATASSEERTRVVGEEMGGMAFGAAGTSLAVAGCIAFGITTGGVGLFVCGLVGGIAGTAAGTAAGGSIAEGLEEGVEEIGETIDWVIENDSPGSLMAPGLVTPYVMRGGYGGLLRSPADVIRAEERSR